RRRPRTRDRSGQDNSHRSGRDHIARGPAWADDRGAVSAFGVRRFSAALLFLASGPYGANKKRAAEKRRTPKYALLPPLGIPFAPPCFLSPSPGGAHG